MATKDNGIILTQNDMKLIALGHRFTEGEKKVNYEQLAKYGGYTKGSAQVMYRKALRKLEDAFPFDDEAAANVASAVFPTETTKTPNSKLKTAKTPRSRTSAKKRKDASSAEDQDSMVAHPSSSPDTERPDESPSKKPKKTSAKKAAAELTSSLEEEPEFFTKEEPMFAESILKTE